MKITLVYGDPRQGLKEACAAFRRPGEMVYGRCLRTFYQLGAKADKCDAVVLLPVEGADQAAEAVKAAYGDKVSAIEESPKPARRKRAAKKTDAEPESEDGKEVNTDGADA